MLLQSVIKTIRRHNLIARGKHILVGVSGGADSIALLAVLRLLAPAWKLRLTVAHLNHGIRGAAAAADAAFVKKLARSWKLEFVGGRINAPLQARNRRISLEMAARAARYRFLVKAARLHHCDLVATAHTADDQAETILLNLARGAGAAGLAGIPYVGGHGAFRIVRPFRDVDRETIERFLASRNLAWREDASNADLAFLRNRVRHEVIPFLRNRLNPGIQRALIRTGAILAAEDEWLDILSGRILGKCRSADHGYALDVDCLAGFPLAARRRVLRRWLEKQGINADTAGFEAVERLDDLVTNRRGGRTVTLSGGWLACRHGGKLALALGQHGNVKVQSLSLGRGQGEGGRSSPPRADPPLAESYRPLTRSRCVLGSTSPRGKVKQLPLRMPHSSAQAQSFAVRLVVPGQTRLPKQGVRIFASFGAGIAKERPESIGKLPAHASLSLQAWRKRQLLARTWRPGDRMRPIGMRGTRKLQDIFSDGKVPPALRHSLPIIECQGEIIWIPGFRIASGWEVRPGAKSALQLAAE